jgi:hypothetical protein
MPSIRFDSRPATDWETPADFVCDVVPNPEIEGFEFARARFRFCDEGDQRRGAWRRSSHTGGARRRTIKTRACETRQHSKPKRNQNRARHRDFELVAPYSFQTFLLSAGERA